jgi:membrane-bound metal-dependent hydrolase YbcI (DUF457 family)
MQKKTHLAFGLMLASIFFYFGMQFQYTLLIGFIAFFPDIDWLVDKLWFKEDSVFKKMWFTIFKSKSIHRTFLHNIWAMIFLVILFGYFSKDILTMFGVFIGYISHLLMDSLTVSGIYWLWPYGDEKVFGRSKFYKKGNFVTGGMKEKFLFSIFVILGGMFFGLGFYKMQPATQDPYQVIVTIAIFLILGSVFMQKLIKGISVATSKMFKTKYSSSN